MTEGHVYKDPPPLRLTLIPLLRRERVKELDPANGWLFPLTPGPSPHRGEGKVTLDLTPSPPSGERVAKGRVRGSIRIFHTFRARGMSLRLLIP